MARLVSAHQPAYLPWLGYFEKIARSDVFVYLDTVQFEKNSFTNRNKVKTCNGAAWLTVPVQMKGHMSSIMSDMRIDNTQKWQRKHLETLAQNYKKAPFYEVVMAKIERFYTTQFDSLSEYCYEYLTVWLEHFHVHTKLVKSSSLDLMSSKSDLVLELCRKTGATRYLSGALGEDYLDVGRFNDAGVEVEFQHYQPKPYPQLWGGDFIPCLGIVDYAMNNEGLTL